nr:hypothetical protein [Tanacetum cinerariifolium]
MQEEMQQFYHQQVWKLVPLPAGKITIDTKWILKNKRDARGIVKPSDFSKHLPHTWVLRSIKWTSKVPSSMGKLKRRCMSLNLKGFEDPYNPKHVYRVVKALYGLHQAPRAWYAILSTLLLKHNYRKGTINKTLFLKKDSTHIILVQVYVDDIIFASTNKSRCDEFEVLMKGEFEMRVMGELTFFLGLQVKQLPAGIFISQDKYVKDMIKKFDMESVRTATTPYEVPKHKSKDKPDDAVNVSPLTSHLNVVKKIFKYLKGQPNLGLWYPRDSPFQLAAYSDSDYAGSHVVATSSTEVEYIAAASCYGQVLWIQNQMLDYGLNFMHIRIFIDNQSTICIVKNPVFHRRTKHIEIRHHFIRDAYEKNLIQVRADDLVSACGCTLPAGSYSFLLLDWFLLVVSLVHTVVLVPTGSGIFSTGSYLFMLMNLFLLLLVHADEFVPAGHCTISTGHSYCWTGSYRFYEFTLHDVLDAMRAIGYPTDGSLTFYKAQLSPQWRFLIHTLIHCMSPKSGGGISSLAHLLLPLFVPPEKEHSPVKEHSSVREPSPVRDPTPVREPTPRPEPKPTPNSPSPPSPPPSSAAGEDATTSGQEFDLAALHTLANVTLGDDPSTTAAHPDAKTTMPVHSTCTTRRRLRNPFTSSVSAHVSETIPAGVRVPVAASTIPATSSVDAAVRAATAPSPSIPTATNKGKAPMLREELAKKIQAKHEVFTRQQEELAQKAQAERVASPTAHGPRMSDQRRQELDDVQLIYTEANWLDLLAKIAINSTLSKQLLDDDVMEENMNEWLGMLFICKRRELAEQSRVKPMTKTHQRDFMQDFVKDCSASVYNQGWIMKKVKTLSIDQLRLELEYIQRYLERSNLLNFRSSTFHPNPTLDTLPAKRVTQGDPLVPVVSSTDPTGVLAAPLIPADVSLPAATSSAPADIPVPAVSIALAAISVPAEPMVHPTESLMDPPLTAPTHGSSKPTIAAPTPNSNSDDDPLPYAPYAGWKMVPSPLGSVHAYHNMVGHTKHFTTLREILHIVERTGLQRLLGAVDALCQSEELDTTAGAFAAGDYIHGTSSCVGDGRWTDNPYVCRCLLSFLCRTAGAFAAGDYIHGTSSCVGDGRWTDNPYVCRCLLSFLCRFNRTKKFLYQVDELRAIFGNMLGAAGVQIPKNN